MLDKEYKKILGEGGFNLVNDFVETQSISDELFNYPHVVETVLNMDEVKDFVVACRVNELDIYFPFQQVFGDMKSVLRNLMSSFEISDAFGNIKVISMNDLKKIRGPEREYLENFKYGSILSYVRGTVLNTLSKFDNDFMLPAYREFVFDESDMNFEGIQLSKFQNFEVYVLFKRLMGVAAIDFAKVDYESELITSFLKDRGFFQDFNVPETNETSGMQLVKIPMDLFELAADYGTVAQGNYNDFRPLVYEKLSGAYQYLIDKGKINPVYEQKVLDFNLLRNIVQSAYTQLDGGVSQI